MLKNTERAIKMDNPEKLATLDTQDEDKSLESATVFDLLIVWCLTPI